MALFIRDKETDEAVRRLARMKGKGLTETIREAVENETRRASQDSPLIERVRALQAEVAKYPATGLEADKAFFDALSGDL